MFTIALYYEKQFYSQTKVARRHEMKPKAQVKLKTCGDIFKKLKNIFINYL